MRASRIERCIAKGQLVPLHFYQEAVAASQTSVDLKVAEVHGAVAHDALYYEAPWEFDIVAMSVTASAAGSAGTLTVVPTIATTAKAAPSVIQTTAAYGPGSYTRAKRGTVCGAAGDAIGAQLTTDGSWNGTTVDIVVTLWVLFHLKAI